MVAEEKLIIDWGGHCSYFKSSHQVYNWIVTKNESNKEFRLRSLASCSNFNENIWILCQNRLCNFSNDWELSKLSTYFFKETEKNKFNIVGTVHVVSILLLKVFLIYFNLDPAKFNNVTNSAILNTGLWLQTEASQIISILYILIGLRNNNEMWRLLHRCHEIDQEFSKLFFVEYHYGYVKR